MKFPRTALTSGGEAYRIRPIQPDDAQRERDFISRMRPQSRYHRFLHNLREPGDQLIDKLVNVDHHWTMALVAVTGDGDAERIIGVARYAADNERECEFAVAIADTDLGGLLPTSTKRAYDVHPLVEGILDAGSTIELHAKWAPNIVTSLGRFGGRDGNMCAR